MREAGVTRVSLHPQQVTGHGDVAVEVSTADLAADSGGPWQLAVDIWNGRPAD